MICSAIFTIVAIVFLLDITQPNNQTISENEVRSQLEQMYDAEVAGVTMNKDVYQAVITKSGAVYIVELDAISGDVYSLEQTDEYIIKKESEIPEGPMELVPQKTSEIVEQPLIENNSAKEAGNEVETVKPPTKIINSEKPKEQLPRVEATNKTQVIEYSATKSIKSASIKVEEKAAEEKPIKEVIKDVIKEALKSEPSKQEETKAETPKENAVKTEVVSIEMTKLEPAKAAEPAKTETGKVDASKSEESKKEETKKEESKKEEAQTPAAQSITTSTETKKSETEAKQEKTSTVMISEEQAIKTAQQQYKGTVESSSFVKTNEGGYYLIVMKATMPESDSKETTKEKKTKATIQVHAISGKILTVTWE